MFASRERQGAYLGVEFEDYTGMQETDIPSRRSETYCFQDLVTVHTSVPFRGTTVRCPGPSAAGDTRVTAGQIAVRGD